MMTSTNLIYTSLACIFISFISFSGLSQQDTSIYKSFGGIYEDSFHSALFDNDSNLVFCGTTSSLDPYGSKAYLIKTDSLLTELWSATYGVGGNAAFNDIIQYEENYLVSGQILHPGSGYDIVLACFNEDGQLLWDKNYGTADWDFAESIALLEDGFLLSGRTFGVSNNSDAYLLKVDFDGELLWEKTFDNGLEDRFYDAKPSYEGNYIMGGSKEISDEFTMQWLVVTDSNGEVLLESEFGTEQQNVVYSVESDPLEESYFILGELYNTENESTDANIRRIAADGTVLWVDTLISPGEQKWYNLELGRFTELVLTGYSLNGDFGNEGEDMLMKRMTRNGGFIFQKSFGTSGDDKAYHGMRISNGYILTGYTNGQGYGQKDGFVIRTRDDGDDSNYSILECAQEDYSQITSISETTAPTVSYVAKGYFYTSESGLDIKIYSTNGSLIQAFTSKESPQTLLLPDGIYIPVINGISGEKFLIVK